VILFMLAEMSINFFERGFRTRAASFNMPRAWVYLAMCVCYFSMLFAALEIALKHFRSLLVGAEKA
jgi:TRAP-type C4-dicarboxylate transport system permease small subunit